MGFTIAVLALGIAVIVNIFFKRIDIPNCHRLHCDWSNHCLCF